MIIAKESISLVNDNEKQKQNTYENNFIQQKANTGFSRRFMRLEETSTSENQDSKKSIFNERNDSFDFKDSVGTSKPPMSPYKESEEMNCNTRTEVWKDYFGH